MVSRANIEVFFIKRRRYDRNCTWTSAQGSWEWTD